MLAAEGMGANRLGPSDPASVFISYARPDEPQVLLIERALQERGVRVLRDKPSLALGAHNVRGLTELVDHGCDAILFYMTDHLLRSDFIWRYEVPTALARWRREPGFHIIPVLQGLSYGELTVYCTDRGLPSLADFNAETIAGAAPTPDEARTIARRALISTLALRRARDGAGQEGLQVCLRTFPYTPPAPHLHLDMDWGTAFAEPGPTPATWVESLLPALSDVAGVLAQHARPNVVDLWLKVRLPVAVAAGYTFPAKGSVRLRLCTAQEIWAGDGPGEDVDTFSVTPTRLPGATAERAALVEVAISREIAPDVTQWRTGIGLVPRWRVRCAPVAGPSRDAITHPAQARAWARRVGEAVRQLWDVERMQEVHLFISSSVEFAALVGQQLVDRRNVHVYYGDNVAGYRLAYTLGPETI